LALAVAFVSTASAQVLRRSVDVDGVTRHYALYLPSGYDGATEFPVLLAYHGGDGDPLSMEFIAGLRAIAEARDFIPVYPVGLPEEPGGSRIWNSEGPFSNGVDEIGFTDKMIDALVAEFAVDETRIYATGYSNGANMSWELACLLSDRIAAIGPVAGSLWTWTEDLCVPSRPVPVVSVHGTFDFFNPYNGNAFSLGLIEASEYWVANNGADPTPIVVDVPDSVPGDGSTVEHFTWENGDDCVETQHYKVTGGGHDWPGAFGNMDIDSSQVIWDFVSQYDLFGKIDCD